MKRGQKMTNKEKLEILKKVCIENIDCKDCKALGIYDNCNNNISECELITKGIIEEVFSSFEKENEQLKQQIEKMKCCNNCKLYQCEKWKNNEINYHFNKCENWELAE